VAWTTAALTGIMTKEQSNINATMRLLDVFDVFAMFLSSKKKFAKVMVFWIFKNFLRQFFRNLVQIKKSFTSFS